MDIVGPLPTAPGGEKVVENLERYHRKTAAWRNKKTNPWEFPNGVLVLTHRREAEDLGKFKSS